MIAIILFGLASAAFAVPTADKSLQFVTFVHRHGDRSPVTTYPNDPHGNESLWNNGWGELTKRGKQNPYLLGKWLRSTYSGFLPETYTRFDYEVRSTDVSRTLMSAYLVLAGLYEPKGVDVWNPDVKWQPIPVHTIPEVLDNVLAANKPCPKHNKLYLQLLASKEFLEILNKWAETISEVNKHAGYDTSNIVNNFFQAAMIYDSLKIQDENGLELPKWAKTYYPKPLEDISSLMLRLRTYNRPLQRLSCGLLVGDILQNFKAKASGALQKKMWQYSAHDITIVGLRQCLGFNMTDSPPYASAFIMELHTKATESYVKSFYKAGDSLTTLTIPGCSELCPLNKFEELVKPIIPVDWEAECKL